MLRTRQALEEIERQTLAPYATLSGLSRGRTAPEAEAAYRTVFQRDRDRILHSSAFRRLEYKTQVFVNDEGDYYRTRLTHTLEVAQIGRTIARALGANEDLVEAICLAHDLGHPPFGHAGEEALNRVAQAAGGFNHNLQTYRVVTRLERRYPGWDGLNLSIETLEGITRHEATIDVVSATGGSDELGPSLEAQIANIADELAYNAHDLDDGLNAGLLTEIDLAELSLWRSAQALHGWPAGRLDELQRHQLVREIVGLFVDDVLVETERRLQDLAPASADDIARRRLKLVAYSEPVAEQSRELKSFLFQRMYRSYRVVRMARRAERFVEQIFHELVADPRLLPPEYQAQLSEEGAERAAADYIASMTDRSALLEYRRLFDPVMKP